MPDDDYNNLIEKLNDIQTTIKNSNHGCILFMTSILKFSDNYFCNRKVEMTSVNIKNNDVPMDIRVYLVENKEDKIISREIILKEREKTKVIDSPKIINNKNIENVKIKINNALALANKGVLMKLKNDWSLIDDYLYDDNYSVVAGLLKDSVPVVASEKYIIVANKLDAIANRINDNANLIENLLFKIFGYNTYVVGMSSEEWNVEKDKYILNIIVCQFIIFTKRFIQNELFM